MKTAPSCLSGNNFRKAFASVAFVAAVLVAPAVSAQNITAQGNVASITKSANEFQAFVHPVENSVSMKVHFVNPEERYVTISIYDQSRNLAYKKVIGNDEVYHRIFDLSKLADGEYQIVVGTRKNSYTRTVTIETQQKRFAMAE